jgi:hypothetical protein
MPDPRGQDGNDERAWGKARARTAGTLMSSPVFTARADWTIGNSAGGTSSSCRWSATTDSHGVA